jgi:hypothetical protein
MRKFSVAGRPFFPLMMFAEHPKRIEQALAIGVNTIAEGSFESPGLWNVHVNNRDFLDQLAAKKLYGEFRRAGFLGIHNGGIGIGIRVINRHGDIAIRRQRVTPCPGIETSSG